MIELALLRENPSHIAALLRKKNPDYPIDRLIELDASLHELKLAIDDLRQEKNRLAQEGKKGVTPEIIEQSRTIGASLKEKEAQFTELEGEFNQLYLRAPNIPQPEVPAGGKEANAVVRTWGSKPAFNFAIKDHFALGNALGWFDFQAAATMTGNNFALYKGDVVSLMHALATFMLKNNKKRGFKFVLPPALVNEKSLEISGNFPKFREEVYSVKDEDLYLIPTSEVAIANMYRDTIFSADQLPLNLTAYTSCFRREAGGYGAAEKGLIRMHQFEKVELYSYTTQEQSNAQLEYMVQTAEAILQALGLHYQVTLLAAQDASFQSAKTYDIEVWMPSQNRFVEVSSCSNCTDFQARRGKIRYRKEAGGKTQYVHTLNASSLAMPRLLAALMETYQQEDGSIQVPAIIQDYLL